MNATGTRNQVEKNFQNTKNNLGFSFKMILPTYPKKPTQNNPTYMWPAQNNLLGIII